jgi:hypothetical protein
MDVLTLSRVQFALTIMFHYLFPPLTIGLGVVLAGYAVLDGFGLGVGILHPVARTDTERQILLNSIGPIWDGNEVWLVTFGGAMFAAFLEAYATIFSSFYIAFMLVLLALIFRAVSIDEECFRTSVGLDTRGPEHSGDRQYPAGHLPAPGGLRVSLVLGHDRRAGLPVRVGALSEPGDFPSESGKQLDHLQRRVVAAHAGNHGDHRGVGHAVCAGVHGCCLLGVSRQG